MAGAEARNHLCWLYAGVETPDSLRIELFLSLFSPYMKLHKNTEGFSP